MGSSSSKSFKQNLVDISSLTLTKKTSLGKHYKNKLTNQQYLLIQILTGTERDPTQILSVLHEHLGQRITRKNRNIPKIISLQESSYQFCSQNSRLFLWMLHPGRSLEEQIRERQQMEERFGEGEIWMIFYSCLCAMISYQSLGYSVDLNSSSIFISEKGDVIVSDAYYYTSFRRLRECKFRKQPPSNILNLCEIVERMMTLKGRQKYSDQLHSLITAIKSNSEEGYQKAIALTIDLKSSLDHSKKKKPLAQNIEHVISEPAQYYQQPLLIQLQANLNEQMHLNKTNQLMPQNGKENAVKHRFYRTTPIIRCYKQQNIRNQLTEPQMSCQKYWTELEQSIISEKIKTLHSQYNLMGQQENEEMKKRELELKNRAFLQMLIMNEKNMILEVSENSQDVSSARSKLSPTISSSFHTFHMTPASSLGFHE